MHKKQVHIGIQKDYYYPFSKSGFTKGCNGKANEMGNVSLVGFSNIIKR